jgi:hypothetical protein
LLPHDVAAWVARRVVLDTHALFDREAWTRAGFRVDVVGATPRPATQISL